MSEYEKTQWHPPFCAAMKLELKANKNDLSFDSERTLNTKPIQVLHLAMIENEAIFNRLKEVPEMNEALIKLMKPELDAATDNARKEGITEGATELATVIKLLKSGSPVQILLDKGYNPDIVKSANELLAEIS